MARPTAPKSLPTAESTGGEIEAVQATAPLPAQNLEDLRLGERVERALRDSKFGALRGTRVSVQERLVLLEGQVPSYYLKQVAQAIALAVPGTHQVRNDLGVGRLT